MSNSPQLDALIDALRCLPGVGQRSAQRMAFHLLQHDRGGAQRLSLALAAAADEVGHCSRCHTFSQSPVCTLCQDPQRDASQLCVVETPADQAALERTGGYGGRYFVLMGRLSPLGGPGPQDLAFASLLERAREPDLREVILALSFTAEGEATAHALSAALEGLPLKVSRLARGVPVGSELEFVDLSTIAHALAPRRCSVPPRRPRGFRADPSPRPPRGWKQGATLVQPGVASGLGLDGGDAFVELAIVGDGAASVGVQAHDGAHGGGFGRAIGAQ